MEESSEIRDRERINARMLYHLNVKEYLRFILSSGVFWGSLLANRSNTAKPYTHTIIFFRTKEKFRLLYTIEEEKRSNAYVLRFLRCVHRFRAHIIPYKHNSLDSLLQFCFSWHWVVCARIHQFNLVHSPDWTHKLWTL